MLFVSVFEAKEGITLSDINRERERWFKMGKDKVFQTRCNAITRYEILGGSPMKIFLVLDTEDPDALNMLSRHFGDSWNAMTCPVIERELIKALELDTAIVAG